MPRQLPLGMSSASLRVWTFIIVELILIFTSVPSIRKKPRPVMPLSHFNDELAIFLMAPIQRSGWLTALSELSRIQLSMCLLILKLPWISTLHGHLSTLKGSFFSRKTTNIMSRLRTLMDFGTVSILHQIILKYLNWPFKPSLTL